MDAAPDTKGPRPRGCVCAAAALALLIVGAGGGVGLYFGLRGGSGGGVREGLLPREGGEGVTTLVVNAVVWTAERGGVVEAMAFDRDGVLLAVGKEGDVREGLQGEVLEVDLGGRFVVPGFVDVHVHVPEAGVNALGVAFCPLDPDRGLGEYVEAVAACAEETPGDGWVRAAGASLFALRGEERILELLDEAVPDRPVLVLDDVGHGCWVNSAGMDAAGIGREDEDPAGGFYDVGKDGELSGLLFESAQQPVRDAAQLGEAEVYDGLLESLRVLGERGVTGISDAGGFWTRGFVEAWEHAKKEGKVSVRARNTLYLYPEMEFKEQVEEFRRLYRKGGDGRVAFETVKIYVDGVLSLGSALLLDGYAKPAPNEEYPKGFAYFEDEVLEAYCRELLTIGYNFNFHVIGDGATRKALDILERLEDGGEVGDGQDRRNRLTHAYMIAEKDMARLKALGVVVDFQVGPASISDEYAADVETLVGSPEKARRLIPVGEALDAGATVTLSSDWDADPLSPLETMARALTRARNAVPDVETAIRLVTINAAYALRLDKVTGSLAPGKMADFVVLDRNLLDIGVDQIGKAKVLQTVLAGKPVYTIDS